MLPKEVKNRKEPVLANLPVGETIYTSPKKIWVYQDGDQAWIFNCSIQYRRPDATNTVSVTRTPYGIVVNIPRENIENLNYLDMPLPCIEIPVVEMYVN